MIFQVGQGNHLQGTPVGRFQDHGRRNPRLRSLAPSAGADTPAITRLEARKSKLGPRRDEVVALVDGEAKKDVGHDGTDRVLAKVFLAGIAAAIAEEAGEWIDAAGGEWSAQDVERIGI